MIMLYTAVKLLEVGNNVFYIENRSHFTYGESNLN